MEGTSVDLATSQPALRGTASLGRARRRALTLSLTVDDAALERAVRALGDVARAIDGQASIHAVDSMRELVWTELSFLAIDVETTGLLPTNDRVIEVAWVRFDRGREVEHFSSLLYADVDVPLAVRRLTGIIPSMLVGKPTFGDVAQRLFDALCAVDFAVAYNARFDRGFLSAELARDHRALPELPWVDPLAFIRHLEGRPEHMPALPNGLVDVVRRFGVALPRAHRAENDARATGELLMRLAPSLGVRTLVDLIDKQERWSRLKQPTVTAAHRVDERATTPPAGLGARVLALFR
jgi:DNA polymerase III epsilon subunit-like protein